MPLPVRSASDCQPWGGRLGEPVLTGLSGQVILCTKEVSVGARKNAFALLVEMGHAFLRFGPDPAGETRVAWGWGGRCAPGLGEEAPCTHPSERKDRGSCRAVALGGLLLSGGSPPSGWAHDAAHTVGSALGSSCSLPSQRPCSATSS